MQGTKSNSIEAAAGVVICSELPNFFFPSSKQKKNPDLKASHTSEKRAALPLLFSCIPDSGKRRKAQKTERGNYCVPPDRPPLSFSANIRQHCVSAAFSGGLSRPRTLNHWGFGEDDP
jgi:hypothetical protein